MFMSYLIRHILAKPRLILDEMCRLYGKFVSYLRRVLCKTRLIFPRINGPNVSFKFIIVLYVFNFNWMAKSTCMLFCFLAGLLFIVKHCTCISLVKDVCKNQEKIGKWKPNKLNHKPTLL